MAGAERGKAPTGAVARGGRRGGGGGRGGGRGGKRSLAQRKEMQFLDEDDPDPTYEPTALFPVRLHKSSFTSTSVL